MTIPTFDPERSAAIRQGLARTAEQRRGRPRLWQGLAAFAVAGALTGGAVSAAAATIAASTRPTLDAVGGQTAVGLDGISAPAGTPPGYPVISMLGELVSQTVTGDDDLPLDAPVGATHVRVTITCLTAGLTYWGTDPAGNNPSIECGASGLPDVSATYFDFSLRDASDLYVTSPPGVSSIVSYQFTEQIPTAWGVNDRGETYGVAKDGAGEPDLILVTGLDDRGRPVDGYVRVDELYGDLPDSPEEAANYAPENREVPVFEADGVTQIGVFTVGAGSAP